MDDGPQGTATATLDLIEAAAAAEAAHAGGRSCAECAADGCVRRRWAQAVRAMAVVERHHSAEGELWPRCPDCTDTGCPVLAAAVVAVRDHCREILVAAGVRDHPLMDYYTRSPPVGVKGRQEGVPDGSC